MTETTITPSQGETSRRGPLLSVPFLGPAKTRLGLLVAAFSLLLLLVIPQLFPPGIFFRRKESQEQELIRWQARYR